MANDSPPELSRLLCSSDPSSMEEDWAAFVDLYSRLLLHTARSFGGDYDSGMDRYAYVLEELRRDDFKRLRSYAADGRSRFSTWLVVVARRLCLDCHRHKYGRDRTGGQDLEGRATRKRLVDLLAEAVDLPVLPDPSAPNPESDVQRAEMLETLELTVGRMEPRDRLLLKLRFYDGVSVREIAKVMAFPSVFHVYRRLRDLFASLRRELSGQGVDGTALEE